MRIVPRAEWGAAPARSTTPLVPARVHLFVLHHTTGTYKGPQTVRNIQKFHQGPDRKWSDIGYNFLIAPDGTIFEGRGWGFAGAHARGKNSESVGVAFIGDGSQPMPEAAQRAVWWLFAEAEKRFGTLRRVGHRDVGSTACPGEAIYRWWVLEPPRAPEAPSKGSVAEKGEVPARGISERPSPIPNVRDGWRRHMARMGWRRA